MKLLGKSTIHPVFFYTGKIAGYIVVIIFILALMQIGNRHIPTPTTKIISYILTIIGVALTTVSMVNLWKSTRLGLPSESTTLKATWLYRYSRNPMYVWFHLITIAAMIYIGNIIIIVLGIYSIIIYHHIILWEEHFLQKRFGPKYSEYKNKVRRYI